ncbi:SDR family NAD(P)-dependent oxidoreductase (plasmid) [Agrobacterium tumefaciens]|uniref:SDR family oxidoreductase n=1 Tax=Agrobacterium tumefaciens TaxID=358 RepID=UPI001572465A|nr:SDR family NAD(P)-dependent oxidoreductase [Agrobacterium tumefaciens]NSZ87122.1 SDR family NAD(P)-dependent oxidoreductase [Agrobacterium tumefaciens]WCA72333.1 SDR family NAD(P)-dependent oxidoreductase [Agrobacterium tumefaciens]
MNSLNGKVVVVTGAGRGLGAAFALSLADAGCELVLCGRRQSDLQEVADLIMQRGGKRADIVTLNLADTSSVNEAASNIAALKGQVDIVINNGAMWLESSIEPYAESDVLAVVNAAITGTYLFVQGLRPLMLTSPTPDIVTIGSISGLPNAALQSVSVPFYAAKRGQVALAEGLRQTFIGSKFRSILINPPYLDDARPDQQDWLHASGRQKGERATSRDIVEAASFALTRPRHLSMTIDVDADDGGLFPST